MAQAVEVRQGAGQPLHASQVQTPGVVGEGGGTHLHHHAQFLLFHLLVLPPRGCDFPQYSTPEPKRKAQRREETGEPRRAAGFFTVAAGNAKRLCDGLHRKRRAHDMRRRPEPALKTAYRLSTRSCLINGGMPNGERFFRHSRRFDAAILCVWQGKSTQSGEKRSVVWAF